MLTREKLGEHCALPSKLVATYSVLFLFRCGLGHQSHDLLIISGALARHTPSTLSLIELLERIHVRVGHLSGAQKKYAIKVMDAVLRKLYYQNLKGFGSAKDLWKLANTKFKITQKQVKEFLDKQENQQRYKKSGPWPM